MFALSGCPSDPTQLLVRFQTDIDEVKTVRVTVAGGGLTETQDFPGGAGEVFSFGVAPPNGRLDVPVVIDIEARSTSATLLRVTRRIDHLFQDRKANIYVFLAQQCLDDGVQCGQDDTCNPCGACEPIVPVTQPSPPLSWTTCEPAMDRDAGPDPSDSGVVEDATPNFFDTDEFYDGGLFDAGLRPDGGELLFGRGDAMPGDAIFDVGVMDVGRLDDGRDADVRPGDATFPDAADAGDQNNGRPDGATPDI